MTFADCLDTHQGRCEAGLARLRMLSGGEAGLALPARVAGQVREDTNAVIAEAEAAGRAALAATAGARGVLEAETFLWVRLARLAEAADRAVAAARAADANGLRQCLRRFDALARAMWAVQRALYGQVPLPPAAGRAVPGQARSPEASHPAGGARRAVAGWDL